jgi:hypothetical protein
MMKAKGMAAGGAAKKDMHKMPDGAMMKDSDMKGMKAGGMAKKGYAAGGAVKKGGAGGGKVRGAGIAVRGVRPAKMM